MHQALLRQIGNGAREAAAVPDRDIGAVEQGRAGMGRDEAGQHLEQGGLAGAVAADDGGEPAGLGGEAQPAQHLAALEAHAQSSRLDPHDTRMALTAPAPPGS